MECEEARQQRRVAVLEVEMYERVVDKEVESGTASRCPRKRKESGRNRMGRQEMDGDLPRKGGRSTQCRVGS